MRSNLPLLVPVLLASLAACQPANQAPQAVAATPAVSADAELLTRGEYLVRIGGCNDCHTPGYTENQGNVDKAQWLVGSPLGYHGPWGTTYASNLRLRMQELSEPQWLEYTANLHTRPIMPDFTVRAMAEDDRRAIYRFVHSLGAAGQKAPDALPPGTPPPAPYFGLVLPEGPAPTGTP